MSQIKTLPAAIVNALSDYVFWKDEQSRYLGCNTNFAQLIGLNEPDKIVGRTDYELPWQVQGDLAECFRRGDQATLAGNFFVNQIETLALPEREPLLVSVTKTLLLGKDGNTKIILGVARDITARKKTEEALKQAEAQLRLASDDKRVFLANLCHSLRTPFSGIIGLGECLIETLKGTPDAQNIEMIHGASCLLLERLNQILELIATTKGGTPSISRRFAPKVFFKEIYTLMQPAAQKKNLLLTLNADDSLPEYLIGDTLRLQTIISSLISNAITFTESGTVEINVRTTQDKYKPLLIFSVKDTGIGIPSNQHSAIFKPFERLQPAYVRETPGTGLGLTLVKDYLATLGGCIEVESKPGEGSCFTVEVPYQCSTSKVPSKVSHILIVEDNLIVQMALKKQFERLNCKVDVVSSASEALKQLTFQNYTFVLTDIGLPDQSGLVLARTLRAQTTTKDLPIIALSAHMDEELATTCKDAGMQDALQKPLRLQAIQELATRYAVQQKSQQ